MKSDIFKIIPVGVGSLLFLFSAVESSLLALPDVETVQLTPEVLEEFGIELGRAGPGFLREEIVLPGEIRFNRERVAHVTPRYTGAVVEIGARLSDRVRKGDRLALLQNTDTLQDFALTAPFDGVVVAAEITSGQTVEAGTLLYTVADLSTVWADLQIYQRDLWKVSEGLEVLIDGGPGRPVYAGEISYVAPTIDRHTRTGLARIVVKNPEERWRPGQFIKGRVLTDRHEHPVVVPRTAVVTHEGEEVVFVRTEEGFRPVPVVLGHSDSESYEVTGGLRGGEAIVIRNVISLKAELGKASFGGHDGHAH